MVGGNLIAVVAVLFFVFLTMAAIVSVVQEVACQILRVRSRTLRNCIRGMLEDDTYGEKIVSRFFRHPRILTPGRQVSSLTHIEPEDFAVAMAAAVQPEDSIDDAVAALPDSIRALKDGRLKARLRLALPDVFRDPVDPDAVKASVAGWYNAQMNKTQEMFRAGTRKRLYITAACLTVLLNVSPFKIIQHLQDRPELTREFAAVVPELADRVYSSGQSTLASIETFGAAPANAAPAEASPLGSVQRLAGAADSLKASDYHTLFVLYQCKRGLSVLPIGWPWMAVAANRLDVRLQQAGVGPGAGGAPAAASLDNGCAKALAGGDLSQEAQARLLRLGVMGQPAPAPQTLLANGATPTLAQPIALNAEYFRPQFGPSFSTDRWWMVFIGWLVTTFAAAQGAPFWFDLLRRLVSRR